MTTAAQQADAARTAAAAALYAKVPPPPPPPPPPPAPLVGPPGQLARPVVPGVPSAEPAVGSVPAASVAGTVTTPPTPAPAPAPGTVPGASTPSPTPAPAPAAPGAVTPAAAAAAARQSAPPSAFPLGNGAGQDTRESDAARPEPLPLETFDSQDEGPSIARIGAIAGCAVGAVLVAVVLMVTLTGDDPAPQPNDFGSVTQPAASPAGPGDETSTTTTAGGAPVNRRATRVFVLNGTTQAGLARALADEVEKARFTIAGTDNNADQAVPTTTVSFRPGNERAAQTVAQVIGIDRGSVQPVDANTTAAADADVVVIVGGDKIG